MPAGVVLVEQSVSAGQVPVEPSEVVLEQCLDGKAQNAQCQPKQ